MASKLHLKLKKMSSSAAKGTVFSEMDRILSLPIREPTSVEDIEAEYIKAHAYQSGFRLFKPQAEGIDTYQRTGKLLGSIGVGWGKTLLTLAIAQIAYKEKDFEKIVLMIPPTVYPQLMNKDIAWIRKKIAFTVPVIGMQGTRAQREERASSGRPGLYVFPYSTMSTTTGEACLRAIAPDLIIADEAHNLKNTRTAKTRRTIQVIKDLECDLVAVSGTITSKSIRDYQHLLNMCLDEASPIPRSFNTMITWSAIMDSGMYPLPEQMEQVMPLLKWADNNFPHEDFTADSSGFRTAYRCRFESSPCVVSTGDADIHTTLTLANAPKEGMDTCVDAESMKEVVKLMKKVEDDWLTPNDDEISYALHKYKWKYELTAGFYNRLIWPTVEELEAKGIQNAKEVLDRSMDYHDANQEFHRELRKYIGMRHRPGLDTPELISNNMKHHGSASVPRDLYITWKDREDCDFPGRVERYSVATRICDYKIRCALDWAEAMGNGIIWYFHQEIGKWLNEYLKPLNPLYCPAGREHNEKIIDTTNKNRIIISSIMAHSTGKNLQHHENQLIVQWPRVASVAEQMLGRTHRNGQEAEELFVDTLFYTSFDHQCFAATLQDALYIHQSTGARQKLVYAHYDPFPQHFPGDFLRERGFDVKRLDRKMKEDLNDKFGKGA